MYINVRLHLGCMPYAVIPSGIIISWMLLLSHVDYNNSLCILIYWIFISRPVWPAGHYVPGCPSVCPSHFTGTTLHAAPSKCWAFSTNYHICIAMPAWCKCAPPILFWHWPPCNLFSRSCWTSLFFIDPHWQVPISVHYPAKAMQF